MSLKNPSDRVRFRDDLDTRGAFGGSSGRRSKDGQRKITVSVLVACAVLAVLVAADYWTNYGKIYPGVEVGSVALGGKTPDEARGMLEERTTGTLREIQLTGGPGGFSVSSDRLGVDYDAWATVEDAYDVGRRGGLLERLGDRLAGAWGTVTVPATVDYNRDLIRSQIENLAARTNTEPQDAYVQISGPQVNVVEAREGYAVNVAATTDNLEKALENMSGEAEISAGTLAPAILTPAAEEAGEIAREAMSEPVILSAGNEKWQLSSSEIGQALSFTPEGGELQVGLDQEGLRSAMSDVYEDLTVEPVEAGFEIKDTQDGAEVVVTKSKTGKQIDEEKLFSTMNSGLFEGTRQYEIPIIDDEPDLTTAEAEKLKPTELIGSYRTNYTLSSDKTPERVENLDIASRAISGTFLAPGEIFSANEILSPLEYNETKVIIEGKEEKADGGGLCQVSSTLYMAANYAGLDIVERHQHDAQLPYIRPGLDATVWFGALDMKFQNTTDGYILIREFVADDGYIYAEIYGRPTGKTVEMDSEPEYVGPDYSKWITYQKVTDEDGEVIFDDVVHKDTYLPLIDDKGKTLRPDSAEVTEMVMPVNY